MTENDQQPSITQAQEAKKVFSFKKLFSDVAIYSSGNLLIKGLSLISAPIFTRIFNPDQYGAWSLINAAIAFLTGILLLGGDNAYTRYFFLCKNDNEKRTLTATWFSFLAIWSIVILIMILPFSKTISGWIMGEHNYRAAWVIGLASSPLAMMNLILAQALRNRFMAKAYTLFNMATAILTIGFAVFFVLVLKLGVAGALLGAATASLIMIPLRLWKIRDLLSLTFSFAFLKQLLIFGLPLVPMNVAFWLLSNADRIMLARLASLDSVGLYAIAGSMAAVIMMLQNSIGQSWLPHGVKVYEEERESADSIFRKTMVFLLAASGFIIVGFVSLSQEVLFILVPPTYHAAFWVIPFLATGFLFFTSAHVSVVAIMVKNKTTYIMFACWVVAILNIALNSLLIPRFGIVGAGAATGISYILFSLGYALISRKLWPINYEIKTIALLFIVPMASILLIMLIAIHGPSIIANLALKIAVLLACGVTLLIIAAKSEQVSLGFFVDKAKILFKGRK